MKSKTLSAVAVALIFMTAGAFAQTEAQPTTVDVGSIFGAWKPYIVEVLQIVVAAIVALLAELARRKFNLSIEAEHREVLQQALTNGAGLVLNQLGNSLEGKTVDLHSAAVAKAVDYVARSAPDAMKKFGLAPEDLREKIVAKVPQVANTTTPPVEP